ncbi:conserved hypothetical protein [Psychromonas ingrahamii 37]|uniref:Calcineurin-like phosphoesterase domain-containing protein n=1 Tax=Psychromonas ingrahamii (strain DSM 17664 / CCUG 51855 / 37) TaxID=357804 RepID=A1SVP3_PSYIN|nr:hypothetical protein [Psychromonas ingrahamii]ABM03558.1 conserved hypothetical protein [Psychromonas ingrahamii 37]
MLKHFALTALGAFALMSATVHATSIEPASVLKVGLWGDQFYSDDMALKEKRAKQTVDSMNAHDLGFTLFTGDTKNGHSKCTDDAIGANIVDTFNSLKAPTLYSVGDNEWTDCHRTSNGGYNPLERLSYLRNVFFKTETTQGTHPIAVKRQAVDGQPYSENSRFTMNNVEFVALAVPGSNNNLIGKEKHCIKKSKRTEVECNAATNEYEARNAKNIEWLKASFKEARDHKYAGIAIVIQADIFFPFELSDGGYKDDFLPSLNEKNGFSDFYHTLQAETHNFGGQVLLVHGDSHYYKVDKPMYEDDGRLTANFTRVQVFGAEDNSWIEMTVDPKSEDVFSFAPVILQ